MKLGQTKPKRKFQNKSTVFKYTDGIIELSLHLKELRAVFPLPKSITTINMLIKRFSNLFWKYQSQWISSVRRGENTWFLTKLFFAAVLSNYELKQNPNYSHASKEISS